MTQPTTTPASIVDDVIITSELARRPSRPPDFEAENRALVELATVMAESPAKMFQKLAESARILCRADSAGVSVWEPGEPSVFRWRATAGAYAPYLGGTLPRHFSPCGTVLDRNTTQLMADPVRFFPYISELNEPVREVLLVPFSQGGKTVGTIWVVAHTPDHRFDAEDARVVTSLTRFAEAAIQLVNRIEETERVEGEMRRSEGQARTILESITDAFCAFDKELRFTYVNRQAEEVLGLGRGDLLGKTQWEVYPHTRGTDLDRHYRQALTESVAVHFENFDTVNDRWYELRVYPSPEGGLSVYFRDITDRKQAEMAKAHLAAIVESSGDAIAAKDLNGIITSWNAGAERLFGYTAEEAIGQPVTMLMPADRVNEEPDILLRIRRGERIDHYETVRQRKDGTLLDISLTVSPLYDSQGRIIGASKVARDITDRKKAEHALHDADRHKNEFLATLAHELRNPLAPIRNALQIARVAPRDSDAAARARQIMERQVGQMVRLIDDLLEVSRISQGKITLKRERTTLAAIIANAVEVSIPLIEVSGHVFSVAAVPNGIVLDGDPTRLTQVFLNLLNNAAKYTERGGRITVTTGFEDGCAVVSVADTGVGIAADMLPKVFDLFTQVDRSLEKAQGGLGIGLSLVQRLVELHGGTVEARSAGIPGRGSEFIVWLPAALERHTAPALADDRGPRATLPGRRILIADDNVDAAESLATLLELLGNEVRTANDGMAAVESVEAFRPEMVLLDIGMPKLNGYDACRRIRQLPGGKDVTLVALTGWGQEDDRRRSAEAGFDHHLVKPVDLDSINRISAQSKPKGN